MSKKDQSKYQTTYYQEKDVYVKVNKETGASWTWQKREKPRKPMQTPRNGLTIESLVAEGNKVRIRHFRYAIYHGASSKVIGNKFLFNPIVVPSTFRHDSYYQLLPKGGYTHITVQTSSGEYFCYSSVCSQEDPFCYRTGIVRALERISRADLEKFYGTRLSS